jgi:hypothetical protein
MNSQIVMNQTVPHFVGGKSLVLRSLDLAVQPQTARFGVLDTGELFMGRESFKVAVGDTFEYGPTTWRLVEVGDSNPTRVAKPGGKSLYAIIEFVAS